MLWLEWIDVMDFQQSIPATALLLSLLMTSSISFDVNWISQLATR
jgi:hypothetical protein